MPNINEREKISSILQSNPINFHFDSEEKFFPIDERINNIESLLRKYNYIKNRKNLTKSKTEEDFLKMMENLKEKFSESLEIKNNQMIVKNQKLAEEQIDLINRFIHNYALREMIKRSDLQTTKEIKTLVEEEVYNRLSSVSEQELPILSSNEILEISKSGAKFLLEKIKIEDSLTLNNIMKCDELTDEIAQGTHKNFGIKFSEDTKNNPPLYYNLQESNDGKKFVMQFGLTYPVNDGINFPFWLKPIIKIFVKVSEKLAPDLYQNIKGTRNGQIGFHLEDRELGFYEGRIENGKYIVEKAGLTGHGTKALEIKNIQEKKELDVYVGLGGHPNYFDKTSKISKFFEKIPLIGLIPILSRIITKNADHADGQGQVLRFDGSGSQNIRNWQEDSILRGKSARGAPASITSQRLFFNSYEDFEQKVKTTGSKIKIEFDKYEKHVSRWNPKKAPKIYKSEQINLKETVKISSKHVDDLQKQRTKSESNLPSL